MLLRWFHSAFTPCHYCRPVGHVLSSLEVHVVAHGNVHVVFLSVHVVATPATDSQFVASYDREQLKHVLAIHIAIVHAELLQLNRSVFNCRSKT